MLVSCNRKFGKALPDLWMANQRKREDSSPIWRPWRAASRWSRRPFRHSRVNIMTGVLVEAARIHFVEVSMAPRSLHLYYPRMRYLFKHKTLFYLMYTLCDSCDNSKRLNREWRWCKFPWKFELRGSLKKRFIYL